MKAQELFAFLNLTFGLVLALKLLRLDLHRLYKLFSVYLIFDLVETLGYLSLRVWSYVDLDYRWVWSIAQIYRCSFYIWMAVSLLRRVMESTPGVLSLAQKIFSASLIFGVACGLVTLAIRLNGLGNAPPLELVFATESSILIVTFLLLLLVLCFIFWFPVDLPRNLLFFSSGYLIFFGTKLVVFFLARPADESSLDILSAVNLTVSMCCLLFWISTLSLAGERRNTRVGHTWNADEQKRLVGQLAAINDSLAKTTRRF